LAPWRFNRIERRTATVFGRKDKPTSTQQLATRPIRLVGAEMKPRGENDSAGGEGGVLEVPMRPSRWTGRLFRAREEMTKKFEFDALGKMVWECCDGKTSVHQIIRRLSSRYNVSPREAQVSVLSFLQMLARKGLIGRDVKENA
jgi:hypothetical protein